MDLKNLGNLIAKDAPLLGQAISFVNPLAGTLINAVAKAFDANENNTQDVADKIQNDALASVKLAQIQFEHHEKILKLNSDIYNKEVDDRISARNFQMQLHDHVPMIISICFVIIYACIQAYCLHYPLSSNDIISARVQDIMMLIIGYYFGSSMKKNK